MSEVGTGFPVGCTTVGAKVAHLSDTLLPARRVDEYVALMSEVLAEDVHYVDPVHDLRGRAAVLAMLREYVPRAANDRYRFDLLVDEPDKALWRWTIALTIRNRWEFVINGLVHAEVRDGSITYQREYYDPMESIDVIPGVGRLWHKLLEMG